MEANKKFLTKVEDGFSLVELMIVVAIIGVLAAIAVPKFGTFQAKARQSEAKGNLSHIYTLEESYYGDHEVYVAIAAQAAGACAINDLGFQLRPCTAITEGGPRYSYITAVVGVGWLGTATAGANIIVKSCATKDTWTVDQDKVMLNTVKAIETCI
jgi:type IV pilus assembly protein PilA